MRFIPSSQYRLYVPYAPAVVFYHNISESVHKLVFGASCVPAAMFLRQTLFPPHDRLAVILSVPVVSAPVLAVTCECRVVPCMCALYDVTLSFLRAGDVPLLASDLFFF